MAVTAEAVLTSSAAVMSPQGWLVATQARLGLVLRILTEVFLTLVLLRSTVTKETLVWPSLRGNTNWMKGARTAFRNSVHTMVRCLMFSSGIPTMLPWTISKQERFSIATGVHLLALMNVCLLSSVEML